MSEDERWRVIEEARREAGGNLTKESELIVARLAVVPEQQIVEFGRWVRERMEAATKTELLLVVMWVFDVNGYREVSGDTWADMIAEFYTDFEDFPRGEEIEFAAHEAYRRATGDGDYPLSMYDPSLIESWPAYWGEADIAAARLVERYPRMLKRFGLPTFAVG